jgi:hypothetical protein
MSWKYREDAVTLKNSGSIGKALDLNIGTTQLAAAYTLTEADNGKTFLLALAGGFGISIPNTLPAGFRCTFRVKIAPTTAYILTASTADTIIGKVYSSTGSDEAFNALGDTIEFVAATSLIGDRLELFFDGDRWHAEGYADVTGSITITG